MGHLYNYKYTIKKKTKINYMSANIWRLSYLIHMNDLYQHTEKKFRTRASRIPSVFTNQRFFVYSGNRWYRKHTTRWMVGYKIGEFTWNKKPALFKSKTKKKKK